MPEEEQPRLPVKTCGAFTSDLPLYMEFIKFTTTILVVALVMIPVVIVLLIITLAQGTTIGGTIAIDGYGFHS